MNRRDILKAGVAGLAFSLPRFPFGWTARTDARSETMGSRIDNLNKYHLSSEYGLVIPMACKTHLPSNESAVSLTPWVP
jgi:hypothetical protein